MPASLMSSSSYMTVEKITGMSRYMRDLKQRLLRLDLASRLAPSGIVGSVKPLIMSI